MNTKKITIITGLFVIVLIFGLLHILVIRFFWLDGIIGGVCELVLGETVYSQEYSETKFRQIQKGMTEAEVLDLLGEPLFRNPSYPDVWFYSYGKNLENYEIWATNSDYTERIIEFKNGAVIEVHHGFYFQ